MRVAYFAYTLLSCDDQQIGSSSFIPNAPKVETSFTRGGTQMPKEGKASHPNRKMGISEVIHLISKGRVSFASLRMSGLGDFWKCL